MPAKFIKWRFDEDIRQKLIRIDWQCWEDEKIRTNIEYFYDPRKLIDAVDNGKIR